MEIQITKALKPWRAAQSTGSSFKCDYYFGSLLWFHHFRVTHPSSAAVFQHQTDPKKLTQPLPNGKAYAFFPLREKNLRLDAMGRTRLLFFQSVQVIVYISPEVFVPVHGFNPECFLSAWKNKLASYLGLLRHMLFWASHSQLDLWSILKFNLLFLRYFFLD